MASRSDPNARAQRSRTIMVTFLGAVVRELGGWMPIGATVSLLSQLGLDSPSVRTTVFRFKERGWLQPEAHGKVRGYRITPTALATLAAGDSLIWTGRPAADLDQGWCIVNASIPESARNLRHKLRAHLAHLGFGNVGTAMWIAPRVALSSAQQVVAELKLTEHVAIFVGDYVGTQNLASLVQQSWDLDTINADYRDFVTSYRPVVDTAGDFDDETAFTTFLPALDRWRRLPFRDPGLPSQVLPADWMGPAAAELLGDLVERLHQPTLRHARTLWP